MRIGLFGGSFDPVHSEHVRFVEAAQEALRLDEIIVMPAYSPPHKKFGTALTGEARLSLLKIAFRNHESVTVSDYELERRGTSYTYLTCRALAEKYPKAERFLLVGADMLKDFFRWKNPEEILSCTTLAVCGRAGNEDDFEEAFFERFSARYVRVPFEGKNLSSTEIRVKLYFYKFPAGLDGEVLREVMEKHYFFEENLLRALSLETLERQEHSYRVALLAAKKARELGIPERKAVFAAALHDCAKYVPLSSPLLQGFVPQRDVPPPVMHQYTGAYLAEHEFGITDADVLNAIRFHTSGRADMSPLEKLIFLADLLEEGRSFEGVETLRKLFFEDFEGCFLACLRQQVSYLKGTGKEVYPLTEAALDWAEKHR